jgi:hypothetical protein
MRLHDAIEIIESKGSSSQWLPLGQPIGSLRNTLSSTKRRPLGK